MEQSLSLHAPVLVVGGQTLSLGLLLAGGLALLVVILLVWRLVHRDSGAEDERLAVLLSTQAEMQGRIAALADVFGTRQAEMNRSIGERLDGMSDRIGATLGEQTRATHDNLRRLQERLAVIDTAQANIQTLAKDMAGLQAILSNKQTRGAFGQARMEAIVADGLPTGAYAFQATLANGARPDCTIRMPNGQPPLVIDAKFPLEAWNSFRAATDPEAARIAAQRFRRDMEVHIRDIAQKYLLPGETQDTAFLFVPSEAIFADIHERFEQVVERAQHQRIVIVSPSLLMLSIQLIQSILRDQRLREEAHLIQGEVRHLMADLARLDERVQKLRGHFALTQRDVEEIVTSTEKLKRRGDRIEALELAVETPPAKPAADPALPVEGRLGALRLRVVDED
ncbi:DNA recombination protein RmuC [Rhizobium sp. RU20A]|uniref:DNA recombination protein RmuC n=1 Tax=Rhizobium sp. RU20A TaxID=1907412 RepID=UPI0009563E0A|nr:DNA recombination protein RmuC [Rhizobium sp. RU20A]SIQ68990.1 DNA recombination protein RmuC [Rhizobium sp. RU20A]